MNFHPPSGDKGLRFYYAHWLLAPIRSELDLSNVALMYFGQGTARILEVKVGVQKKNLPVKAYPGHGGLAIFFNLQLWHLIFLQPLDLQKWKLSHLKDLIHICLEPKDQDPSRIFDVSKILIWRDTILLHKWPKELIC